MVRKRCCRWGVIWTVLLAVTNANGETASSSKPYTPAPRISFPVLLDPTTLAVALKMDHDIVRSGQNLVAKLERFKRYDLDVRVNGLYPMRYHPEGVIEADIGVNLNWITKVPKKGGPRIRVPEVGREFGPREPYFGSISIDFAGEACQITNTEKWHFHNYNLALTARAQVPRTRIDLFGWLPGRKTGEQLGTCPLELRFSLKAITEDSADVSTYARYDMSADWGFYLIKDAYFYPYFVISQKDGGKIVTYFRGEVTRYFEGLAGIADETDEGGVFKPYVLFRYAIGKQPPAFEHVSELYIGLGANLPL